MCGCKNIIRYYFLLIPFLGLIALSSCKTRGIQPSPTKPVSHVPVPVKQPPAKDDKDIKKEENVNVSIALIMPFEIEDNFSSVSETAEPEISQSSLAALNFYEGALLAADSLKTKKKNVTIKAYDTPSDSMSIFRMLYNPALQNATVVIGTFPNNLAPAAAAIAAKAGVNLVLTQAADPGILDNNKHVALAYASTLTQCREMVSCMMNLYDNSNNIMVFRNTRREDELAAVYRQEFLKHKESIEYHELNATEKSMNDILKLVSKTKRNVVYVISSDEAFVSPLLALLESQNILGIMVGGLPTWQNFESIDFMTFTNIQVHIFDNNFIAIENEGDKLFRKSFVKNYYSDPLPAAYNGFELTYKIGDNISVSKPELQKIISNAFKNDENEFWFGSFDAFSGNENKIISVLKFSDYKLIKLDCKNH